MKITIKTLMMAAQKEKPKVITKERNREIRQDLNPVAPQSFSEKVTKREDQNVVQQERQREHTERIFEQEATSTRNNNVREDRSSLENPDLGTKSTKVNNVQFNPEVETQSYNSVKINGGVDKEIEKMKTSSDRMQRDKDLELQEKFDVIKADFIKTQEETMILLGGVANNISTTLKHIEILQIEETEEATKKAEIVVEKVAQNIVAIEKAMEGWSEKLKRYAKTITYTFGFLTVAGFIIKMALFNQVVPGLLGKTTGIVANAIGTTATGAFNALPSMTRKSTPIIDGAAEAIETFAKNHPAATTGITMMSLWALARAWKWIRRVK
jgi:hypothetical protein